MADLARKTRGMVIPSSRYRDVEHEDFGGRGCGCVDPEGNVWSFGTYDPWAD